MRKLLTIVALGLAIAGGLWLHAHPMKADILGHRIERAADRAVDFVLPSRAQTDGSDEAPKVSTNRHQRLAKKHGDE